MPLQAQENETEDDITDATVNSFAICDSLPITCKQVRNQTCCDADLMEVYDSVMKGWSLSQSQKPNIKPYYFHKREITAHDGCLMWGSRVIIPNSLRSRLLKELHDGHVGIVKMKSLARSYFWWPGLDKDIENMIKNCNDCQMQQNEPSKAPLHHWEWPQAPWIRVHVDFAGPFKGAMFLIVVDAYSKWPEVIKMSSTNANSTIRVIRSLFARYGLPEYLVSDNGPQFSSHEFANFLKANGIKHKKSAPYHPASNGAAERFVQTFKRAMRSVNDANKFDLHLDDFLLGYRNTPHCTTGEAPSVLFCKRRLRTILDLIKPNIRNRVEEKQYTVRTKSNKTLRSFSVGETVLVRDYRGNSKWKRGEITKIIGPLTYMVSVAPNVSWKRHIDQIIKSDLKIEQQHRYEEQLLESEDDHFKHDEPASKDLDATNSAVSKSPVLSPNIELSPPNSPNDQTPETDESQNPTPTPKSTTDMERRYPLRQRRRPDRFQF
uniref:uncharacterized protein K02A2.6-like n=1 Tax=Styela clava TaxID=7725 RepID=UPI001939C541|nr:uncharacterized protein K02A2.6-like [Styela clava]